MPDLVSIKSNKSTPNWYNELRRTMKRVFKFLIYLAITGAIALVNYTYLGPFFGISFEPNQTTERVPVVLNEN